MLTEQWIEGGKLYREPVPREVPRFELFFDLLYVGIIHQLAEAAIEDAGGLAVARFILTFYPSWSIWEEARRYSNVSGVDDLFHRLWVLAGMACMLGYSVSASAIELHPEGEEGFDSRPVHCAAAFWLIIKLTRGRIRPEGMTDRVQYSRCGIMPGAYRSSAFPSSSRAVPRLSPCLCTWYVLGCGSRGLPQPLVWVKSRPAQIALATAGICLDLLRVDVAFLLIATKLRAWRNHRASLARVAAGQMSRDEVKPFNWHITRMGDIWFSAPGEFAGTDRANVSHQH